VITIACIVLRQTVVSVSPNEYATVHKENRNINVIHCDTTM
jgi:hypothetical protein